MGSGPYQDQDCRTSSWDRSRSALPPTLPMDFVLCLLPIGQHQFKRFWVDMPMAPVPQRACGFSESSTISLCSLLRDTWAGDFQ